MKTDYERNTAYEFQTLGVAAQSDIKNLAARMDWGTSAPPCRRARHLSIAGSSEFQRRKTLYGGVHLRPLAPPGLRLTAHVCALPRCHFPFGKLYFFEDTRARGGSDIAPTAATETISIMVMMPSELTRAISSHERPGNRKSVNHCIGVVLC